MIKKAKQLPFVLSLLVLYGCPDEEGMKTNSFIINNETSQNMKVKIYEKSSGNLLSETTFLDPNTPFGFVINDGSLQLLEDFVPLYPNPIGDSAIIVLGDRYLIYSYDQDNRIFIPNERNIFRISNYAQETPTIYTMELTQEDYDNAIPCTVEICGE